MIKHLAILQDTEQLAELALTAGIRLAAAIAIFYFGKWASGGIVKLLRMGMQRGRVDETLRDFLSNVIYGVLLALVVISALTQLGVETTSAAAIIGGATLAIGLSLQNQLSSFAAGVIIILFRPFSKGDYVEISGQRGTVEEIKIVSTQLRTLDNKLVIVPNSSITSNVITNYTARATRRLDITVSIGYDADLRKTKQILEEILAAEPRVLKAPAPSVQVKALGAAMVDLSVWPWVQTPERTDVEATLLETIKLRLEAEGIALGPKPATPVVVHVPALK